MTKAENANRNPAVDRMARSLDVPEERPNGMVLNDIAMVSGVTRSSAYRILVSLEAADLVRRFDDGTFSLGSRLISLGETVTAQSLGHRNQINRSGLIVAGV